MITKWAIASTAEHASVSLHCWVRYKDDPDSSVTMRALRLFDTERDGKAGLAEFRSEFDARAALGQERGSSDEWHLWRVEYHEYAEKVI